MDLSRITPLGCRPPYPYVRGDHDHDHDHTCSLLLQYMHRRDRVVSVTARAGRAAGWCGETRRTDQWVRGNYYYYSLNSIKLNSLWQNKKSTREFKQCVCMIHMYEGRGLSFGPTNRALTTLASFFFFDIHSPPSSFLAKTIYNNN